ncbi:MAG TPA: sensor histidine kinase [Bryobacteraceae bacterium]|nr:sensor histidine kinase [Bryobacteraceae bacterium]
MRQRPRVVLVAGFGGLLLIMALAEAGALFFLNSLRHNDSALQARFLGRNRTLERIRSNIYLSGTFVRDSLLAPEQSGAQAQLATLDGLRRDSESALNSYAAALEPEEAAPFQDLRSQIEAYWKVLNRTFAWTSDERGKYRYAFFYEELVPRRTSMLQIADRIEALNEDALRRGDMKLGDLFGRLQFGLLAMIGITLLGGATLAACTIFHILKLEAEVQQRLRESVHAQASLQELSARLVRAQEEERRALSRELHDEVAQAFSAVLMEAENLLDLEPGPDVRTHLDSIRGVAEKGMNEIRNMALLLRPSMLDDFGLLPALEWQAREIGKRTGLRVQVVSEMLGELPEEHKTCVYRVVQEALNNCAQHAQASAVQVLVRHEAGQILVTVQDDGSGFDPGRVRGLGLLGMEERARHLGGTFQIDSSPGRGTLLRVTLPRRDVVTREPESAAADVAWNGGFSYGADSHSAG